MRGVIQEHEDEVRILSEETGCSVDLARKVLFEEGGNLKKAFLRIAEESKHFYVLKGKFGFPQIHSSALFMVILNLSKRDVVRCGFTIVSTPVLFEERLDIDHIEFERTIYSVRLDETARRDLSNKIQQEILLWLRDRRFFDNINNYNDFEIEKVLKHVIERVVSKNTLQAEYFLKTYFERVSLSELRGETLSKSKDGIKENVVNIKLDVSIPKNGSFRRVLPSKIKEDDMVLLDIVDKRDIGIYISQLLGGRVDGRNVPVPCIVEKKEKIGDGYIFKVRFAHALEGELFVRKKEKVPVYGSDKRISLYILIFLLLLIIGVVIAIW